MRACIDVCTLRRMRWADYVRQLVGNDNQVVVSQKTGIDQTTISRWLRGDTTPGKPAAVAHIAQVYGGNVLEAFVAAGFLTREQANLPPEPKVDFAALIDADPDLSPEAKVHIKNQYGLLKAASQHSRVVMLREQIVRNTNIDEETRQQMLATLDGSITFLAEAKSPATANTEAALQQVMQYAARESTGNEVGEEPDPNVDAPGPEHGA